MKTFFIDKQDLVIGNEIVIDGVEHNHLSRVLRLKVDDEIQIYNNSDNIYYCTILTINKKFTKVKINSIQKSNTNPQCKVDVFIALLKGDKLEFLITKLTELGITTLIPFESEYSIGKNVGDKKNRFLQIAKDACKQCKRTKLINIEQAISFNKMVEQLKNYNKVIFAYENYKDTNLTDDLNNLAKNDNVAIIVGSEGGFSEKEVNQICSNGATCVSLGNRILRAETACIMLSTIVLEKMGEFNLKSC